MANKKITELDAITTLASTDVVPVVDVSADTTNKITAANLFRTLPDGTAAAPALAFSSDAANGVYLAGTDTVGISTGGTQRVTVDGSGNVTISGDLTVSGATTTVESTTVTIDDKNIELGSVATPTDTTADGGGITLKGATDHTIIWTNSTDSWDFSEHVSIASGKEFRIAGTKVLDATSLGSAVVSSSLTSVGTLGSLAVTNNITVGGTVDGRDVATDGTKLDGIETGATADQTKSDIDALGIDAATLDSIDSTSFLRSDAADTKTSGDLSFSDSVKATFGTGNDLEIYHDGSNSYIKDAGTGNLLIQGSSLVAIQSTGGETIAKFTADGASVLNYNGVEKLTTKSDGVDITGELLCDSAGIGASSPASTLHISGSSDQAVTIQTTTSGADSRINFRNSSGTDAGGIFYKHNGNHLTFHTGGSLAEVARIDGSGRLGIGTTSPSSFNSAADDLVLSSASDTGITINAGTSNSANIFFADSGGNSRGQIRYFHSSDSLSFAAGGSDAMRIKSDGKVGIGTTSPSYPLEIRPSSGDGNFVVGNSSGQALQGGYSTGGAASYIQAYNTVSSAFIDLNVNGSTVKFGTGSGATERFRITSTGAWAIEGASNYGTSGQVLTSNGNDAPTWQDATGGGGGGATGTDYNDNVKVRFGTGNDLEIYHDSVNSNIVNNTGDLYIQGSGDDVIIRAADDIFIQPRTGENGIQVLGDGAVKLAFNSDFKFETKSDGVDVTGELQCDSLDVDGYANFNGSDVDFNGANYQAFWDYSQSSFRFQDNAQAKFGTGEDLQISHDGSNSFIYNYTADLFIGNAADDKDIILQSDNGSGGTTQYIRCDGSTGSVRLYYYGSQKLTTKSDGVDITGELQCDSLDVDGAGDFTGLVAFRGGGGAINVKANSDIRFETGTWTGDSTKIQHHNNILYIQGGSSGIFFRDPDGSNRVKIDSNGHLIPNINNTYDLGTSTYRWRNVYTNDLNLSNEGSTNDVDGTWGNYTIQEGEDDLFLINRRNGKKYKFNLTEVS